MGLSDVSRELNAVAMIGELAALTDSPPGLTRTFLSPASLQARELIGRWMRAAGLEVFEDRVGNIIGRRECGEPGAAVVACGSHFDTVRDAGRFDGALGVVAAIVAAAELAGGRLPFDLEVVAFSDEEGVRFQTTYLSSAFYGGASGVVSGGGVDAAGIPIAAAVASHVPVFPAPPARRLAAYVEAHIEQGPVLESEGFALGVVSAIAGQTRLRVGLSGRAGHAGTTPMRLRRDALAGAAECLLLVERLAGESSATVGTVGCLDLHAPASNVIPGAASFSIDIRDADDAVRMAFVERVLEGIRAIADRRGLGCEVTMRLDEPAVKCDPAMMQSLAAIVAAGQGRCPVIVSGAGHDAAALAAVARVAMVFVRCRGGLSHHPEEFAAPADIEAAVRVLTQFLREFRTV